MRTDAVGADPLQYPVATAFYDAEFRFLGVNDAWMQLTGWTREQAIGQSGWSLLHPDDQEPARLGLAVLVDEPRRQWPAAYIRVTSRHGGWTYVATHINIFDPAVDGIHFVLCMTEQSLPVSMNGLVDVLAAGRGISAVLDSVITATESTGHYAASLHHRRGFTTGPFTEVVAGSLSEHVDLRTLLLETVVSDACRNGAPVYARLADLGIDEPLAVSRKQLVQCVAYPFSVKGELAGALCAWNEFPGQLGPFGAIHLGRVARLAGEAISNQIDADAARPVRVIGDLRIDLAQRVAVANGQSVKLTPIEVTILDLLSQVPGRVVSRERIMMQLFGSTHTGGTRTCDAHVKNLRAKLNDDPAIPRFIATVRGEGYALILGRKTS
jgi:PAS domain S-box-containing protein